MTLCARVGCHRPIPIKKTKPSVFCSTACRVADFRRRERVRIMLREIGFDDLVTQLRCAIVAQQRGQSDIRDATLSALASHPLLIAGSRASADKNGAISSSQRPARSRIGIPIALGGEEDRGS